VVVFLAFRYVALALALEVVALLTSLSTTTSFHTGIIISRSKICKKKM